MRGISEGAAVLQVSRTVHGRTPFAEDQRTRRGGARKLSGGDRVGDHGVVRR